jgi:hypothetical protein
MLHCTILQENTMQTNFMNTLTAQFKPWADLTREMSDAATANAKAAKKLMAGGMDQAAMTGLTDLATKMAAANGEATVKALRLVSEQTQAAFAGAQAKAPALDLNATAFIKQLQEQMETAQTQFKTAMEKATAAFSPAATATRKAARAV